MTKGFYIGKKDWDNYFEGLEEWVAAQIPPPPIGAPCECDAGLCHEDGGDSAECTRPAATYIYFIRTDQHVCYNYVCGPCAEANACEDYLADQDYPVTEAGYAVVPIRCINE